MQDGTESIGVLAPANVGGSWQWMLLSTGSVLFVVGMLWVGLPGAWLLGPMMAGILVGVNGGSIRVAPVFSLGAQALLGCMIAGLVTRPVMASFAARWPIFLAVTVSTTLASALLGWLLYRRRVLPGTTAIWGMSPGAASAMMLMAESHGGDSRLVAFMQYSRVICVAFAASLIARVWIGGAGGVGGGLVYFPALRAVSLAETLAIAGLGMVLATLVRIPTGHLLVPLAAGSVLQATGVVEIELPRWLLVAAFVVLGWGVGLRFTRAGLAHAARSFPAILASIMALMVFCGGVALVLHRVAGVELLTAYLATSPGGVDSALVIAAASPRVDMAFVMGLQTVRLLFVLFVGPSLARFLASRSDHGRDAV